MDSKRIEEIKLRLKAPMIILEKIIRGHFHKIFAKVVFEEFKKVQKLLDKLEIVKRRRVRI